MHGVPEPEGKRFYSREFSRLYKANQSGDESIVAEVTRSYIGYGTSLLHTVRAGHAYSSGDRPQTSSGGEKNAG